METRKQQWEMLASPGHVLLAQVNAYKLKTKLPLIIAACAFALVFTSFWVTPLVSVAMGSGLGWVVGKASGLVAPKAVETTPAPELNNIAPTFNLTGPDFDGNTVPKLIEDVLPAMRTQVEMMTKGQKITDCDFTKKITDSWSDGKDMSPKCRYSSDNTRLYVWAVVNDRGGYRPWAGLIVKADGNVVLANLDLVGAAKLPDVKAVNLLHIPRTLAADFPELLLNKENK